MAGKQPAAARAFTGNDNLCVYQRARREDHVRRSGAIRNWKPVATARLIPTREDPLDRVRRMT